MFRAILLALALIVGVVAIPAQASASSDRAIVVAAHNGSIQVSATSEGLLSWRKTGEIEWKSASLQFGKNGVSNLYWNGSHFIATSFFSVARSKDGKNWTRATVPVGQAFNPGNVISDSEFFKRGSMTRKQIQEFLDSQVEKCAENFVCLKDYSERTFDRAASPMCDAYRSGGRETAAQIIARVSQACGVSAEVLLVLLQKEQSLVTLTAPSRDRFDRATGYACPDTAPCNTLYFGFYNQVYHAAKQFKRYSNPPGTSVFFTWYPVGKTSNVLLHPNRNCGTTPVKIRNQATAALYYYTPYTPNGPSLQAFSGTGDSCSSYGNRNFWRLHNLWFNQTRNYSTWYLQAGATHLVIDGDGSVSRGDHRLSHWSVGTRVPGSESQKIRNVGYLEDGSIGVVRHDGRIYSTFNGTHWAKVSKNSIITPSPWTLPVSDGTLDGAPEPPKDVRVAVGDDVTVTWASSPGIESYKVYLFDRGGRNLLGVIGPLDAQDGSQQSLLLSTTDVWAGLQAGATYRIAVSAAKGSNESKPAQTKQSIFSVGPPSAPISVQVILGDQGRVTWAPPLAVGGAPVTAFRVHLLDRKGKVIGDPAVVAGNSESTILLEAPFANELREGSQYRVTVTAVTTFGESKRLKTKHSTLFTWPLSADIQER
jgi:hypothetical protein